MPEMKMAKWIWWNGRFVPSTKKMLHIINQGLHYGYGCFEGLRFYKTTDGSTAIFRLKDHLNRLRYSAKSMYIDNLKFSIEELEEAAKETVRKSGLKSGYMRPIIFCDEEVIGMDINPDKTSYAIIVFEWDKYFTRPIRTKISPFIRPHPRAFDMKAKTCGMYVNSIRAKTEAKRSGFDDAIMLDHERFVAELSAANLFVVRDNWIITPRSKSILHGFTRDTAIKICQNLNLEIFETDVTINDLFRATEIFVCGTAAEITPLISVNGEAIGDGKQGPVTKDFQNVYDSIVTGRAAKYKHWLTYV